MFPQAGLELGFAVFDDDPEREIFSAQFGRQDRPLFFNGCGNQVAGYFIDRQVASLSGFTKLMDDAVQIICCVGGAGFLRIFSRLAPLAQMEVADETVTGVSPLFH